MNSRDGCLWRSLSAVHHHNYLPPSPDLSTWSHHSWPEAGTGSSGFTFLCVEARGAASVSHAFTSWAKRSPQRARTPQTGQNAELEPLPRPVTANRPARPPLRQRLKGGTKDRAEAVNGRAAAARPPPALRSHRLAGGPAAAPNGDGQRRGARQWGPAGGGGGGRRGRRPVEWGVQRGASRGGPLPCLPEARGAVLSAAPRSAPLRSSERRRLFAFFPFLSARFSRSPVFLEEALPPPADAQRRSGGGRVHERRGCRPPCRVAGAPPPLGGEARARPAPGSPPAAPRAPPAGDAPSSAGRRGPASLSLRALPAAARPAGRPLPPPAPCPAPSGGCGPARRAAMRLPRRARSPCGRRGAVEGARP